MNPFGETLSGRFDLENPVLQGASAALATFVLEDPTSVGCGLLVADGKMLFATAWIGLTAGIALGDLGLYGLGRFLGKQTVGWGLVSESSLAASRGRLNRNLLAAVLASRFLPGMRLPTYVGAGVLRADFPRFLVLVVGATILWTTGLLVLTVSVGESVFPVLGAFRWPLGIGLLAALVLVRKRFGKPVAKNDDPVTSRFEFWHPVLFYAPVACYWLWQALRLRGLMLPTLANPKIYTGGWVGESKSEILDSVAAPAQDAIARYTTLRKDCAVGAGADLVTEAESRIRAAGIDYPFVAKPDIGQRGAGVWLIRDRNRLVQYLNLFPVGRTILFQELAAGSGEAGILYYRKPNEESGRVLSITLKVFPHVTGDGRTALRDLILNDPRAARLRKIYFSRHVDGLDEVLPEGDRFPLVFAGNHAQGCIFKNGSDLIAQPLLDRIESIARAIPEFYFGRFDVRFEDRADLKDGRAFTIVEINGAAAEATHIWDARTSLGEAYRALFEQFRILFEIGRRNRSRGFSAVGPFEFVREFCRYLRVSKEYPPAD